MTIINDNYKWQWKNDNYKWQLTIHYTKNLNSRANLRYKYYDGQSVDWYISKTHGRRRTQRRRHRQLQPAPVALERNIPSPKDEVVLEHLHYTFKTQKLCAKYVR